MLRIGIIGCGFMGSLHARTLASLEGAKVTAVADPDLERARRLAQELGAQAYASAQELLDKETLEGVVIATPDGAHREPVELAAQRGVGVLVEKPLATNLEDADAMIQACRSAGVALMVGHILRFEPAYVQLRQAVQEGLIGRFVSAFARRHALRGEAERLARVTSVVQYLAIHDFDQLNWIQPAAPRRVTARAARRALYETYGTPDVVFTTIEYEDGSLATVESGWSLTPGWANWRSPATWGPFGDVRLDVTGEDGFLSLDLRTMNLMGVDTREGWRIAETRHWPLVHGRIAGALRLECEHFLDCLRGRQEPLSSGETARQAVALLVAAQRSLESGEPVDL